MNSFFVDYFSEIIPLNFRIKENGRFIKVGNGKPEFTIYINRPLSKLKMLRNTSLSLAEAYIDGSITTDADLYYVMNILLSRLDHFNSHYLFKAPVNIKAQKKQVTSHYDLGNNFYSLWLDDTMTYSCGYFKDNEDTLNEAQINKTDHILSKLNLKEGMNILDIGCGWGFLLIEAAKKYGVTGVGITLSSEQYKKGMEEIERNNLLNKIQLKIMDYRELKKSGMKFDRVVSVGMIEHVGRGQYDIFMENVNAVLKSGGLFLLHFISGQKESRGDAFITKYIFPGGVIPSLREIISILPDYKFYTLDVESLRRHYTKTLLCWYENFKKHKSEIIDMKGMNFTRMWEIYLLSCAAAFNNGIVDLHQILISKGANNKVPLIRVV